MVSLAAVHTFLKENYPILENFESLRLALSKLDVGRGRNISLISRRSWVHAYKFVPLLTHQFYFKRFFGIYERVLEEGETLQYNYEQEVDLRELSFILKRANFKM